MKIFKIFIVFSLVFSCSHNQKDERIIKFENILGERQTNSLNSLVMDFENNLDKNYPDLAIEKAYRKYLTDLISDRITDAEKFKFQSEKTNLEFHDSGLWNEVYEYNYAYDLMTNDSTKFLSVNNIGKYMQGLYEIRESDSLIKDYYRKREAAGIMSNEIVIPGILSSNPNFKDYFHKRIVVLEFSF